MYLNQRPEPVVNCARGVEDLALGVATLRGVPGYQRQIGRYKGALLIGHVGLAE
jgi:hypothetical protein